MPLQLDLFSRRKRPKKRHSVFSHHAVDQCDVLSRPLLPLEKRTTSPADLIDLVGHPRLAISHPPPHMKRLRSLPAMYSTSFSSSHYTNDSTRDNSTGPATPSPQLQPIDKTLLSDQPPSSSPSSPLPSSIHPGKDVITASPLVPQQSKTQSNHSTIRTRIHYTETLYNQEEKVRHPSSTIRQRRRSSPPTFQHLEERRALDRLETKYEKERSFWQQQIQNHQKREKELMDLLEATRAKLDQLELNYNQQQQRQQQYCHYIHHHRHHHHHYVQGKQQQQFPELLHESLGQRYHHHHHYFSPSNNGSATLPENTSHWIHEKQQNDHNDDNDRDWPPIWLSPYASNYY